MDGGVGKRAKNCSRIREKFLKKTGY